MVQGCVGSQLSISCPEMKVIKITAVIIGDSYGVGTLCYITDNDCTHNANANHTMDVHRRCDGQSNCTVDVLRDKIPCGYLDMSTNNDYERITYTCIDDPRKRVQGCVGSRLSLSCAEMKVIQITAVVLGDSVCHGRSCCIKDSDCTHYANENHTLYVHLRCDYKQSCIVDVFKEGIPCGALSWWSPNDFERITFDCIDDPRNNTMNSIEESTKYAHYPDSESADKSGEEQTKKSENSATFGIVIACVVCLIVIIAIVASVSVVTVRRKRKRQVISSDTVKISDLESDRKDAISMNEAQGTSLNKNAGSTIPIDSNDSSKEVEKSLNSGAKNFNTATSDYCELQCESKYVQLYEPIIVREQPQIEKFLNGGENASSDYCELKGMATKRIQYDSDYLQLYEPLLVYKKPQ